MKNLTVKLALLFLVTISNQVLAETGSCLQGDLTEYTKSHNDGRSISVRINERCYVESSRTGFTLHVTLEEQLAQLEGGEAIINIKAEPGTLLVSVNRSIHGIEAFWKLSMLLNTTDTTEIVINGVPYLRGISKINESEHTVLLPIENTKFQVNCSIWKSNISFCGLMILVSTSNITYNYNTTLMTENPESIDWITLYQALELFIEKTVFTSESNEESLVSLDIKSGKL